jgi:diaminopimelate decarboxylase
MSTFHDPCFDYQGGTLFAEDVNVQNIVNEFGTPCYVYSKAALVRQWQKLDRAFSDHPHQICFAVKANSNIAVLNILAKLGSGFDIVSAGELHRVLRAGGDPRKVIFSGVAKSKSEIAFAINSNIKCFNVESLAELERVQTVAEQLSAKASIGLRVNPDVDAQTHPYIATGLEESKFGITMDAAFEAYEAAKAMPNIHIHSIACHIGSQITKLSPFRDAVEKVFALVNQLKLAGIDIEQLDLGGGLGIRYKDEKLPSANDYIEVMLEQMRIANLDLPIAIEPGRYISGNSGILLTTVEYLKHNDSKNFAVVDAGMNDLLRPSLYQAYHQISNIQEKPTKAKKSYDIVGPVCESADVLAYDHPIDVAADDVLAIQSAGAYAFSMASNYNSRPRPPEIMVDDDQYHLIRKRESYGDLTSTESLLP